MGYDVVQLPCDAQSFRGDGQARFLLAKLLQNPDMLPAGVLPPSYPGSDEQHEDVGPAGEYVGRCAPRLRACAYLVGHPGNACADCNRECQQRSRAIAPGGHRGQRDVYRENRAVGEEQ